MSLVMKMQPTKENPPTRAPVGLKNVREVIILSTGHRTEKAAKLSTQTPVSVIRGTRAALLELGSGERGPQGCG